MQVKWHPGMVLTLMDKYGKDIHAYTTPDLCVGTSSADLIFNGRLRFTSDYCIVLYCIGQRSMYTLKSIKQQRANVSDLGE
jgi:hypothetical protein